MSNYTRSQFRVQSLEEFLNADAPLLSWEEIQQKLLLSPDDRPSMRESTASEGIDSLLSASSYPLPEPLVPQGSSQHQEAPLYGGFFIETPSSQGEVNRTTGLRSTPESTQELPHSESSSASSLPRKRGRPRKNAADLLDEDPEERRRSQIRLAQRAYRSRREKSLLRYKNRISRLETAVEETSASVLSLSQQLVQSGALASNSGLADHLHNTVLTCLRSVKEARSDGEVESPKASPTSEESLSSPPHQGEINPIQSWVVELIARSQLNTPRLSSAQNASIRGSSYTFGSTEIPDIELPAFIERLQLACLSQGYLALRDRSISIDRLRRPFRLLLSFMSRERITSYFEAALQSRLGQQRLDGWKDVPFFSLGGAGAHYSRTPQESSSAGQLSLSEQWVTVQDPLAQFPPEVQEELNGDWFTLQDLEIFLRQKGVHKLACAPVKSRPSSPTRAAINVARLIHGLISRCICLGRSPGFRRSDVEKALSAAVLT